MGSVARLGIERVDLLKMNIEGAERLAITAMDDALERTRHIAILPRFPGPLSAPTPTEVRRSPCVRDFLARGATRCPTDPTNPGRGSPITCTAGRPTDRPDRRRALGCRALDHGDQQEDARRESALRPPGPVRRGARSEVRPASNAVAVPPRRARARRRGRRTGPRRRRRRQSACRDDGSGNAAGDERGNHRGRDHRPRRVAALRGPRHRSRPTRLAVHEEEQRAQEQAHERHQRRDAERVLGREGNSTT